VIEGRFLPYVCVDIPRVVWIELRCDESVRQKRYIERRGKTEPCGDLERRDLSDQVLAERLYSKIMPRVIRRIVIDTSNGGVDDVVADITKRIPDVK